MLTTFRHLIAVRIGGTTAIFLVLPWRGRGWVVYFCSVSRPPEIADSDRLEHALPIPIDATDAGGYNSPRSWSVALVGGEG